MAVAATGDRAARTPSGLDSPPRRILRHSGVRYASMPDDHEFIVHIEVDAKQLAAKKRNPDTAQGAHFLGICQPLVQR
ncbi:MAG: hypothetical protein JWO52_3164 [Gammaproteobacteria bacterium]|nr:hypothetical protein [Gammaproteobacteria bacterium]